MKSTFVKNQGLVIDYNSIKTPEVKSNFNQEDRELTFLATSSARRKAFEKEKEVLFPKELWIKNNKIFHIEGKTKFSQKELDFFSRYLNFLEEQANFDLLLIKNKRSGNGTDDTHKSYKPFEDTSDDSVIDEQLAREKYLSDLKRAKFRMKTGDFGICKTSGKLIHPWRLFVSIFATERIDVKLKN